MRGQYSCCLLGIFPGRGETIWRDWYTHKVVNATPGENTTLDAPLGHIPVHIRGGSAILLFSTSAYTVEETRSGGYSMLVSLAADGTAFGTAYIDDGLSVPPTPHLDLTFSVQSNSLSIQAQGDYTVPEALDTITILGVNETQSPTIEVNGQEHSNSNYDPGSQELVLSGLDLDLNDDITISWSWS